MSEHHIFIFLLQIFLLLGLSHLGGEICYRLRQPAVTAEILVGVCLGPTILGRFFPSAHQWLFPADPTQIIMLETIAWVGAFLFLLQMGLEVDFISAWRQKGAAFIIAISDIIIPMLLGFTLAWFLPDSYRVEGSNKVLFCLFMAVAMTISAMPIAVRILHDLNLSKTDLGFLILSALSINDIIGWLLFTIIFGFFISPDLNVFQLGGMFLMAFGFIAICLTVGRDFSNWAINMLRKLKLPEAGRALSFIFLLGVLCGAVAHKIGLHALFGFFLGGIVAGGAQHLSERTRHTISQVVYSIFVPLFFATIGLKMDFFKFFDPFLILFVAIVSYSIKFTGAYVGATISGISAGNRSTIALAHTPGGMMEIVMGLLALQHGVITETVFVAIVCAAMTTAIAVGPWLTWTVRRRKEVAVFEFFSRGALAVPLRVSTRQEAIATMASIASDELRMIDAHTIIEATLTREGMMGTALEEGIAIPHARLKGLHKPLVVFGRSLSGIDWDSPDGKGAQFIFLILTPETDDNAQIQILRAIVKMMTTPQARADLLAASDSSQIWNAFHLHLAGLVVKRHK